MLKTIFMVLTKTKKHIRVTKLLLICLFVLPLKPTEKVLSFIKLAKMLLIN